MGTLDQPDGAVVRRKIQLEDITGKTPVQIESVYNNNYGQKGWKIIQILEVGSKRYILAEKEE